MTSFSRVSRDTGVTSLVQLLAYGLIFLQLAQVAEAGKFSNFCKSLVCYSSTDTTEKWTPPAYKDVTCKNSKAPKDSKGWNIAKTKGFPTVQDIVKDLELCGIATAADTTMMFYSFNGKYEGSVNNAERFQKQYTDLNAKQINDVMPTSWHLALGINNPKAASGNGPEQQAWIARLSQALATVAKGDVYMIAKAPANIYTVPYQNVKFPWYGKHNVWYDYEFGQLQRNSKVDNIYTVDSKTLEIKKDAASSWTRGGSGDAAGNYVDANTVTPATIKKAEDDWKAANECGGDAPAAANANAKRGSKSSAAGSGTAAAGAACTLKAKTATTGTATGTATGTKTATKTGTKTGKVTGTATGTKTATKAATKTGTKTGKVTGHPTTLSTRVKTGTASITKARTTASHTRAASKTKATSKPAKTSAKKTAPTSKKCPKGKKTC